MNSKQRLATCCFFSLVLFREEARASESFPDVLRQTWAVESLVVPGKGCLLCHTSEAGNSATVQRPFGLALLNDYGVTALNVSSLRSALREMQPTSDVDGDGVTDYDELLAGRNPNFADQAPPGEGGEGGAGGASGEGSAGPPRDIVEKQLPVPQTGCGVASRSRASLGAWLLFCSALVVGLRRRSLRSRHLS